MSVLTPARFGLARLGATRLDYPILAGVRVPLYAQFGIARLGATRLNYHSPVTFVSINGVHVAAGRAVEGEQVDNDTLAIEYNLNESPDTARCTTRGFIPVEGHEVIITLGSKNNLIREFGGRILSLRQYFIGTVANYRHDLQLIDYTWDLNRIKVRKRYTSTTVAVIAADLITYAPGFTVLVADDIGAEPIDEITFTEQDLAACFTQLTKRVADANWVCDYRQVVKLFHEDLTETNPTILNAVHPTLDKASFSSTRDLSPVVTRVYVEGGGVNAGASVGIGETILPVDGDVAWYEPTGGVVVCGPQRISYTGKYAGGGGGLVGTGAAPSAAPVLALASGAGLADGTRDYAATFVTPAGESIPGPRATITSGLTPAPTTAPAAAPATIGSGPDPGAHSYAVTFATASGETTAGPTVTRATDVTPDPVAYPVPGTPTTGTGPDDGLHEYAVTFVTSVGETVPSPISPAVLTGPLPAPSSAPVPGTPTTGTGPDDGLHGYAVTFVTAAGETTPGPISPAVLTGPLPAPSSAPVSAGTPTVGTGPDPGSHDYAITFVTAAGETTPSPRVTIATDAVAAPASAPTGTPTFGTGPDPGNHDYAITFVNAAGETTPGPSATIATGVTAPPATAPVSSATPTIGTGPDPGSHDYAVTFVSSAGETTAGPPLTKATDVTPAPVSAPTPGTPTVGTGVEPGDHTYAVTFVTSVGETTPSSSSATATVLGIVDPILIGAPVTDFAGPLTGTYRYKYLFHRTADGLTTGPTPASASVVAASNALKLPLADCESPPTGYTRRWYRTLAGGSTYYLLTAAMGGAWNESGGFFHDAVTDTALMDIVLGGATPAPASTTVWMGHVPLTAIPTGDANVTSRKIYRTAAGGSTLKLVATIANNVSTTYTDSTPDASLGAVVPSTSTAYLQRIALTGIPTGPSEVTSRKIYRTVAGGSQLKLLTTIGNNSTTTFSDTIADASLGANVPTSNTATLNQIALAAIPTGPASVTSRKIYRTAVGGSTLLLVATIANNTATTFTDTVIDASLGAAAPGANTATLNRIALAGIATGPASVTARKIYRTAAGGSQLKLVATLSNNTTTTFTDTVTDASLGANAPTSNTAAMNVVPLTGLATGPASVTARKIYRTAAGGSQLKLVATLGNNSTTTYTDSVTDASLGANAPTSNTAAQNVVPLTGIPVGDANVTSRKLYRRSGGAGLKLLATIADNFTTSFSDTVANASLGAAAPTVTTALLTRIALSAIPIGSALVTSRKIYRTAAGGVQLKLLTTIADNTTTTFSDTIADASLGANVPVTNTATANQVALASIPIGAAAVTQRKIYRTVAGGAQLKLVTTIADNATSTYTDSTADGSLGANVPTVDTSGLAQPQGNVIAGSTSLQIASIGAFPPQGWAVIGNGQQVVRYTGISGTVLTGIPASGPGSIEATIAFNSTVTAPPQITGIPASGAGSILYPILKGDEVNLFVQVDDLPAQAALSALRDPSNLLGGAAGIQEDSLQDRRLSHREALARGTAHLALRRDVAVSLRFQTRDINTRAGRTIRVNLGPPFNIAADFMIQSVSVTRFLPAMNPTYDVSASSVRFTFDDLLRSLLKVA